MGSSDPTPDATNAVEQIRVIQLENKNLGNVVYRLEKGTTVQFRLSPELWGHEITLYANHPQNTTTKFCRTTYHKINWIVDKKNEETYTNLRTVLSGCFQFYFEKDGVKAGSGYFLVDPVLRTKKNNEVLPLDSIMCQTFLPKSLGPFDQWKGRLEVAYRSGYNMIHFTPIQELGASNSSYSISNQLALNPLFGKGVGFEDVGKLVDWMKQEWGVLSICDVVFNHTANETPWLKTHPEVGFNLENSPHLRPGYLLDCLLYQMGKDVGEDKYKERGLPSKIDSEHHLTIVKSILNNELLPKLRIEEMFQVDVDQEVSKFQKLLENPGDKTPTVSEDALKIIQDPEYRRLKSTVDLKLALQIHFWQKTGGQDQESAVSSFRHHLEQLNHTQAQLISSHLSQAVDNVLAGARYERLQPDGPKLPKVTKKDPLFHPYFVKIGLDPSPTVEEEEASFIYNKDLCKFALAHNGWVMNDNPLRNFAEEGSNVYLRRELIAWGDSVKLRYGDDPKCCPFLWETMKEYVETTAKVFHGIRLDNCHSTPIHVAEYLLDAARSVRPDLYVVAELFTNSDQTDNIFVNRLGITSLIREALSAWDSHEEGRLIHRFGGLPVGAFFEEPVKPLVPSIAHALLMDQTHDNPSPIEKRSVYDILPTAALVAMAGCATGSNRGLDELVPHHIHVVNESRPYTTWSSSTSSKVSSLVNEKTGIIRARKVINDLHTLLGKEGFDEVFVDQMEYDIVAVTRHHPLTHSRIVLVSYTAFSYPDKGFHRSGGIKDVVFEGVVEEVIFECQLKPEDTSKGNFPRPSDIIGGEFEEDPTFIKGLTGYECSVKEHFPIGESKFVRLEGNAIKFSNFQPGSVIAFRINPPSTVTRAVATLRSLIRRESLEKVIQPMSFNDLNFALYKCEEEEKDLLGGGAGCYTLPGFGPLVYAGIQGVESVLSEVRLKNDTGHPICNNLRGGDWLLEYTYSRLLKTKGTSELGEVLKKCGECLREIPRYLAPCYFDAIIRNVYMVCMDVAWKKMSKFVQQGGSFTKALAMGSIQCCGLSLSGALPPLSPKLDKPPSGGVMGSLAAGLTHFATGYMRNWGRDTFISLPGLLILTGRNEDARNHVLSYASVLRHGLIPNLLDRGVNSRYNCRDATWFWLQSIKIYVETVPGGSSILKDPVSRMWPDDSGEPVLDGSVVQPLEDVIHEALQKHFQRIKYRERNAGSKIDAHMKDEGFNVEAGVNLETGFIYGGNPWNCGTWMDKMGSSDKAGNRGVPATPRDGSAVELVGLSASVLKFLAEMHKAGKYKYNVVERKGLENNASWTLSQWYEKIKANFEPNFWIPVEVDPSSKDPQEKLINRRGIYKDTLGSSAPYCDYQLRPNFLVAMTVAPDLFTEDRGMEALRQCEKYLLSLLGMRTLDSSDWNYNGDYDNSNDSTEKKLAHGFNYHNGPEWLWPIGFYLRAYLNFSKKTGNTLTGVNHVRQVLARHWSYLMSNPWKGLPELTNKNGAECWGSCRVQAWSMATMLEVLNDLEEFSC